MKTDMTVAGYLIHDGKLLLIFHKKLKRWLPIGGHIEKDEIPDDAVIREIKEETELEAEIVRNDKPNTRCNVSNTAIPFHTNVHSVGDHDHYCLFYLCKTNDIKKLKINSELEDFRWFTKSELENRDVSEDVRNIGLKAFELYEKIHAD
ncbi:MAG: NUDIX domain-containing protein [Candidatus Aenigmarchaeota archaeon]|nr:NUDIX domain-containing protein [Candidatus Aenigmarchaeota archaeon]